MGFNKTQLIYTILLLIVVASIIIMCRSRGEKYTRITDSPEADFWINSLIEHKVSDTEFETLLKEYKKQYDIINTKFNELLGRNVISADNIPQFMNKTSEEIENIILLLPERKSLEQQYIELVNAKYNEILNRPPGNDYSYWESIIKNDIVSETYELSELPRTHKTSETHIPQETKFWVSLLISGIPKSEFTRLLELGKIRDIKHPSPREITRLYTYYLGRGPTYSESIACLTAMENNGVTYYDIQKMLLNSPERKRIEDAYDNLITKIYNSVLGRNPGEDVYQWISLMKGVESPGFKINRLYNEVYKFPWTSQGSMPYSVNGSPEHTFSGISKRPRRISLFGSFGKQSSTEHFHVKSFGRPSESIFWSNELISRTITIPQWINFVKLRARY